MMQAYLDLIELLGNAALEHRCRPKRVATATTGNISVSNAAEALLSPVSDRPTTNGNNSVYHEEDAGGVMLSILTCHCVAQFRLFKRLVRAAVRFDGVGLSRRSRLRLHVPATCSSAMVAKLELRSIVLSRVEAASDGGKGAPEVEGNPQRDGDNGPRAAETAPAPLAVSRPPLERCSRLLGRCIQWIRSRQGDNGTGGRCIMALVKDEESESSEEATGNSDSRYEDGDTGREDEKRDSGGEAEGGNAPRGSGGHRGRYSFRPEEVKLATSRECYAAVRSALLEIETGLSSAAGVGSGGAGSGDGSSVGCGSSSEAHLAEVIEAAAAGLREFFAPAAMPPVPVRATQRKGKGDASNSPASSSAPPAAAAAVSAGRKPIAAGSAKRPPQGGGKRKKSSDGGHAPAGSSSSSKTTPPPAAIDLFPEHAKLLLMRVLERVFLVGRTAAVTASAALSKPLPPATVACLPAPKTTCPSEPLSGPLRSSPIPPPSKRCRQQQQRATENAGRPGDQAGGEPCCVKRGITVSSDGDDGGVGSGPRKSSASAATTPSRSSQKSRVSTSKIDGEEIRGSGSKRGVAPGGSGSCTPECSRVVVECGGSPGEWSTVGSEEGDLLTSVLPAVVVASGDFLHLIASSRAWAEAQRAKTRRAADDPCRKRVSGGNFGAVGGGVLLFLFVVSRGRALVLLLCYSFV